MRLIRTILATGILSLANLAQAALLTFDDLGTRPGLLWRAVGQSYTAEGFQILGTGPNYSPAAEFHVFDEGRPEWNGTPGLTLFAVSGRIELRSVDGTLFSLDSIDIARGDMNLGLVPVGFTGYRADGTTVQATYRFADQVRGRNETFSFGAEFEGLTSVVWYQGAEWHQFDNIRLSTVSEPATAVLAIGALLGAATRRRVHGANPG